MGFEHFIEQWGYLAILIGTLLEGETIVIAAGAMAHRGLLLLPLVIMTAFFGTFIGDLMWFFVGRKFGRPLLSRSETWRSRSERISALIQRYGIVFVLGYRFIYGIRTVTPAFLGATGYPLAKYLLLNVISIAVWSVLFSFIGFGAGLGFKALFH